MSRTPVCLVTGFLGSGKTTFLQNLVERYQHRRLVYLVNEFSPADVDGRRLALPSDRVVSIAGGSIFCQCLVTEFIAMLRAARTFFTGEVEGVVIEASGVSDPRVFDRMLKETQLDQVYSSPLRVTLVDPGTFLKLLKTLPNIRAQAEAADIILLNKTDLYRDDEIAMIEAEVRGLNPHAWLLRTKHARAEIDVLSEPPPHEMRGVFAACRDPNFCTSTAHPPGPVKWEELRKALDRFNDVLYRVKGFVLCSDGWRYVDWAAGVWNAEKVDAGGISELVLIARGDTGDRLRRLRQRIEAGTFSA
jgi:G3E family GTPase